MPEELFPQKFLNGAIEMNSSNLQEIETLQSPQKKVIQTFQKANSLFRAIYLENEYSSKIENIANIEGFISFENIASKNRIAETIFLEEDSTVFFEFRFAENFVAMPWNANKTLAIAEEVSHFLLLVESLHFNKNVSIRDLEAWGEIDRFLYLLCENVTVDFQNLNNCLKENFATQKALRELFELFFETKAEFATDNLSLYLEAQELAYLALRRIFSGWLTGERRLQKNWLNLRAELVFLRRHMLNFGLRNSLQFELNAA